MTGSAMSVEQVPPVKAACVPGVTTAPASEGPQRREAAAAWLALTAPGSVLARCLFTLALLILPTVSAMFYVATAIRIAAGMLLLVQISTTVVVVRRPAYWPAALAWLVGLLADAVLCGILIGADPQWSGPGVALVPIILAISFAAQGGGAMLRACAALGLGAAIAFASGMGPSVLLLSSVPPAQRTVLSVETHFVGHHATGAPREAFTSQLSVETSFAGRSVQWSVPPAFPISLEVETSFAGVPVFGSSAALFLPVLAVFFVALCVGTFINLLRIGKSRDSLIAEMMRAGRACV